MIRVVLPAHLRTLAGAERELVVDPPEPVTQAAVLSAVEDLHPVLRGTMRDRRTGRRRPFVRFFAGEEDLSHEETDAVLPAAVRSGAQPFVVVGAMAGG